MSSSTFSKDFNDYQKMIAGMGDLSVKPKTAMAYNYSNDTSSVTLRNNNNYFDGYEREMSATYGMSSYSSYSTIIQKMIWECMTIYDNEPIVSNVIDLMSDFGSQGVRITCADKQQEEFGKQWFKYIHGQERCERFLNLLFKAGTVVCKRTDGKVPLKTTKKWKIGTSKNGEDGYKSEVVKIEDVESTKAVIPLKWTFHNPVQVVMIGGQLANFVGKPIFGLKINTQLRQEIAQLARLMPDQKEYKEFVNMIPQYVMDAINTKSWFFPLDQSKVHVFYYKKDDWLNWGKPIIQPIIRDIRRLNELKAADSAALRGAISSVRLWQLGSLEKEIVPTKGALDKVRNMLANIDAAGSTDVVWGPDLTFKESSSNLWQWLGSEKYQNVLASIYAGLGVPQGLTGTSGGSFTNNYTGLQTLIERLTYGRTILLEFLSEQLSMVQKSMGFTKEFKVEFDQMVLSDKAALQALLLQMHDRDLISTETLRYSFNIDNSDVEDSKIKREARKRGGSMPNKASPYHNPEKEHELIKLAIQKGGVTPSQVGLNLPDKKPNEETFNEELAKTTKKVNVGSPLTGRPKNSKDQNQRKKRRVLPKGASAQYKDLFRFAETAQSSIEEILNPAFLAMAQKKNIRSLSVDETNSLESLKFRVFSNLEPYREVNVENIHEITSNGNPINEDIYTIYKELVYTMVDKYGRDLTISEKRNLMCESYAEYFSEKT